MVFCEFSFVPLFVLPGNPLIFACGAFYASGALNGGLLLVLLPLGAVLGSLLSYVIGRALGRRAVAKEHQWLNPSALRQARMFYERYGALTFLLSPFIAVVRTFAPFVAGMGHMSYHHFLAYNVIGGVLWVTIFSYLGYFFGNMDIVKDNLSLVLVAIIVLSILPAIIEIIRHKRAANKAGAQ